MGRLDQYAKEILADETPAITRGGAAWQPPAEISLSEVRLDGCLFVRDPARLLDLPAPWSEAREHDEIVVDVKMQGDHLDMYATERGLLRRQARQVQRMADPKELWDGDIPFWMIGSRRGGSSRESGVLAGVSSMLLRVSSRALGVARSRPARPWRWG